jgi:hypothetical protein
MHKIIMLALAAVVTAGAAAAASPDGVSLSSDNRIMHATHGMRAYTRLNPHRTAKTAIYDGLAELDPNGVYLVGTGDTLGGPKSVVGQIWLANAFTPAANATVTEVDVAAGYAGGATNEVMVHIYADAAGLPGQELWAGKASLPNFGDCCAVGVAKSTTKLALSAGTQYWVGITTLKDGTDTFAAWDYNVADQIDAVPTAWNHGDGWVASTALPVDAFAVYGN